MYWEGVRRYYAPFESEIRAGTADVYRHEMPGGQYTNLRGQARSLGIDHRWTEVSRAYADVNRLFGDIVKVTPSSKVVGDLAIYLVSHGMTVAEFERLGPDHQVPIPNSVADMFSGSLGIPEGGWPPKIQRIVLHGKKPERAAPIATARPSPARSRCSPAWET